MSTAETTVDRGSVSVRSGEAPSYSELVDDSAANAAVKELGERRSGEQGYKAGPRLESLPYAS